MDERGYRGRGHRSGYADDDVSRGRGWDDDDRIDRRDELEDDRSSRGRAGAYERDEPERYDADRFDDERRQRGGMRRGLVSYGRFAGAGPRGRYSGTFVSYRGLGPRGYRRSDERIREDVCERLTDAHEVDAREVEVDVRDGIVVLSGTVEDRRQKRAAEDELDDVQGIRDVENRLRVRSGMADDDRARRAQTGGGGTAAAGIFAPRNDRLYRTDLRGFEVEAPDGGIGKVDDRTEPGSDVVVVDTGPWIFGRHVLLPLGLVERVDLDTQTVFVDRTKDEIKDAPEYSPDRGVDDDLRRRVGEYYTSRRHGREPYEPEEHLRR